MWENELLIRADRMADDDGASLQIGFTLTASKNLVRLKSQCPGGSSRCLERAFGIAAPRPVSQLIIARTPTCSTRC